MDSTAKEFEANESGCNFCAEWEKNIKPRITELPEDSLKKIVDKIKSRKGSRYDCLLGVSGGVDSTYLAYYLKIDLGLNPLLVHLDNGWNSDISSRNIENVIGKLGLDYVSVVLPWQRFKKLQRAFILSNIANVEMPTDHAIWAVLVKTARKYGIKYIIGGNNPREESIMPESWLYNSKDFKIIKSINKKFSGDSLSWYPKLTLFDYILNFIFLRKKWIPIFDYISISKKEAKRTIEEHLGWIDYGGKHYESTFTKWFNSQWLYDKCGIDIRKSFFSAQICSGEITREEAMDLLSKRPVDDSIERGRELKYVCKKLGFTLEEMSTFLRSNSVPWTDYSNNSKIWKKLSSIIAKARENIKDV